MHSGGTLVRVGGTANPVKNQRCPLNPNQWPGRPIIPNPNGTQQMPPGHNMTRFYALLPLLAAFAALAPAAVNALTAALTLLQLLTTPRQ